MLVATPFASADDPDDPVRLVVVTAGLTWEDIDPETTPHLQCLADRSGAGAMNTTSTSVVSTKRQGLETLHTGYRGLAEEAPRTSGIPTPATDQWEQVDAEVSTFELDGPGSPSESTYPEIADALEAGDLVQVTAASVPRADGAAREQALSSLDATVGAILDEIGGCDARDAPPHPAGLRRGHRSRASGIGRAARRGRFAHGRAAGRPRHGLPRPGSHQRRHQADRGGGAHRCAAHDPGLLTTRAPTG